MSASPTTSPGPEASTRGVETRRLDGRIQAYVARKAGEAGRDPAAEMARSYGAPPDVAYETERWSVGLRLLGPVETGSAAEGRIHVVSVGELLPDGPTDPDAVAAAYARDGESSFAELNGSFSLVVVDGLADRVLIVADRMASRRLYVSEAPGGYYVTTDLADHPTDAHDVDPVAAAWYMSSAFIPAYRTPFVGVRPVERAHALVLGPDGAEARRYWSHLHVDPQEPESHDRIVDRLTERLIEAVRRRARSDERVYLSMSGGVDSVGIAVVLAHALGHPDVQAFSYALGPVTPETDAGVAGAISRILGLPHRAIQAYDGDLLRQLRINAEWGEGAAMPIHEVETWVTLGREQEGDEPVGLLAGDEHFGYSNPTFRTRAELVANIRGRLPDFSHAAVAALPDGLYEAMRRGTRGDLESLVDRQPETEPLGRRWEYVGLDQMACHLMPWRERFQARFFYPRNPWLDSDVMDFMIRVPHETRTGKGLYRESLLRICPEFADFPRPEREGFQADYEVEVRRQADALEAWMRETTSRLDEVIPPEFGFRLLRESRYGPARLALRRTAFRTGRRLRSLVRRGGPQTIPRPSYKTFRHYAALRMALAR